MVSVITVNNPLIKDLLEDRHARILVITPHHRVTTNVMFSLTDDLYRNEGLLAGFKVFMRNHTILTNEGGYIKLAMVPNNGNLDRLYGLEPSRVHLLDRDSDQHRIESLIRLQLLRSKACTLTHGSV